MTLTTVVFSVWGVFWICWLLAAAGAKKSVRTSRFRRPGLVVLVAVVLVRLFKPGTLAVSSPVLHVVGLILFALGLALAVWARIYLGRNPIYSGILLALLGTALATNLYWLIVLAFLGAYFTYSATVEERLMTTLFPGEYESYKAHTKMLIPFVL